ncbi:MAG: glycosyltransferase [Candidatus Omnitrophica bacterium]|jgi:GT2 family glycosyltransferase|nr:glycosyltransferase [Candidatus Omnitrophota bacterium]
MLLSIIIPSTGGYNNLKIALDTIYTQKNFSNYEVIVIINGFLNDPGFLTRKYPNISLILNQNNKGSSFARNQGLALAKGEYIMFMDCDVELQKDFLFNLQSVFNNISSNVAGIAPKIIDKKSRKIFSCGLLISTIYRVYDIGKGEPPEEYSQVLKIDGPNSCCAVFKREYLDKIKKKDYFDNDFFFLFEDADLALRLKKKGYNCLFTPQLVCFHQGNSSGISQEERRYLCFRNRLFMILNNNSYKEIAYILTKSFFYDLFRTLHLFLTNRYALKIFSDLPSKYRNEKRRHN